MAVTALSGQRWQGSSTFATSGKLAGTSGTGSVYANWGRESTNDNLSYDLGATLSETAWVMRFKLYIDTFTLPNGSGCKFYFGMSDSDADTSSQTGQDSITFQIKFASSASEQNLKGCAGNGGEMEQYNAEMGTNMLTSSADTTYYVELKRTADDVATISIGTNSDFSTGRTSATIPSISSGISGLQYVVAKIFIGSDVGNHVYGDISEVQICNGVTTFDSGDITYNVGEFMKATTGWKINDSAIQNIIPISPTDEKTTVTDVPVGSEFEETDTYKFYQMSDTWVTTSGSLSAGVYHPSGKGDATDGWNTTGIGVVGGGNRPELDWWNGTTWADKGVDMTKAMEGACGVGTSSSITVAGGDYQSDDSGAGNACQHWNNTSWTTKANMDQGKSTASSMGTSSSWLSCGGEITGGGGGRTAEVQEYDLSGDSWSSGTSMPSGASIDGVNQSAGDGTSISNGMCVGGRSTDYTITVSANAFNGTNWTSVSVPDISWSMYAGIGGGNYDGFWVMGGNLSGGYGTGIGAVTYYNGTSWTTKANCALTEGGAGGSNNGGTNPQIGGGNEVGESGNGNWTSGQYWGGAWLERGTT